MTQQDVERLNLVRNDVNSNKLKDSSLLFRSYLIHELDLARLCNLAVKAANSNDTANIQNNINKTNPTNNKPDETTTKTKNTDMTEMDTTEMSHSSEMSPDNGGGQTPNTKEQLSRITTTDSDIHLKNKIKDILENETLSCQSKSSKIMSLLYQHRRQETLRSTRETLDNSQRKLLLKGGGNDDTKKDKTDSKTTTTNIKRARNSKKLDTKTTKSDREGKT